MHAAVLAKAEAVDETVDEEKVEEMASPRNKPRPVCLFCCSLDVLLLVFL